MKTIWTYNEIKNLGNKFNFPLWDCDIRIIKSRLPTVLYIIHELNNNNNQIGGNKLINNVINNTKINSNTKQMRKVINNINSENLRRCHNIYNLNKREGHDLFDYILKNKWDVACNLIISNNY